MTRNPSASTVMRGLKDFQRQTVEYAFARMFDRTDPATRFLVADEVGLGKTMIAKGLIAKTIDHLADSGERVDIVYVCSNAEIAAQNVQRLTLPGQPSFACATRLTLLPLMIGDLRANRLNLISFTPGTTFGASNRTGRKEERRLIYQMLRGLRGVHDRGLRHALKGAAGNQWDEEAQEELQFDRQIAQDFSTRVAKDETLLPQLCDISSLYLDRRRKISDEEHERCTKLVGDLRRLLAKTCLAALRPALVILDEFQRFGELFEDPQQNPSAELAHELFNYSKSLRVLLLSATPYKMYARDDEAEDHYADFLRTLQFLYPRNPEKIERLEADIRDFRTGLLGANDATDLSLLETLKGRIEATLRSVMCRTERVGATVRADAMVKERLMLPRLTGRDLKDFRALEEIRLQLGERDTIEYWKSSPYLLNFMGKYELKNALREQARRKASHVADILEHRDIGLLRGADIRRYGAIDSDNARLRALVEQIDTDRLWKLLWMPPSLNYWRAGGEYEHIGPVSKYLVFSAWNVVPDALAAMLSFEAERRLVDGLDRNVGYAQMPKRFGPQLRFSGSRDGRPVGMSALLLAFPSQALVDLIDPLSLRGGCETAFSYEVMRARAVEKLAPVIEAISGHAVTDGLPDRRWYWVALAQLEAARHPGARTWCESRWTQARREHHHDDEPESATGFGAHVQYWLDAWDGKIDGLGRVPSDLLNVLADIALASPATCALRTLTRQWPQGGERPFEMLDAAALIAEGMRSQFNSPRAVALLKAVEDEDSYWQRVLQYGADGNLQALLDEYAHVLFDSNGLGERAAAKGFEKLAESMYEAMSLRSATLRPDEIVAADGALQVAPLEPAIRTHFALRFGTQDEEAGAVARKESVQAAFNSPFWPFVLASTSVGQEGLDFHTWCHSVIHWNLPSNPVDMEQREGRVHRYKGYAVRKNVATRHGVEAVRHAIGSRCDLWNALFDLAVKSRDEGSNDLIPYWIYEIDGGAQIERTVMTLPLSRDEARYRRLKRSLALYRMVFAQPRQEDLLACLEQAIGEDGAAQATERWRISLRPMTPDTTTVKARLAVGIFGIGATASRFVDELKATSKAANLRVLTWTPDASGANRLDANRGDVAYVVWNAGEMSDLDSVRHSLQSLRNVGCSVVSFVVGSQRLEPGAAYHAQEVRALSDVQIELAADNFEPVTSSIICAVAASPGVQGMVGIAPGDIRSALADSDEVRSGIGHGTGANRATQAAIRALNSAFVLPDLLTKATGVVVVVGGSKTLQLAEICAVTDIVREFAGVDTHVYSAAYHDEHLEDTLRVTLLCAFP